MAQLNTKYKDFGSSIEEDGIYISFPSFQLSAGTLTKVVFVIIYFGINPIPPSDEIVS